ncbi:unnamed protein product, partial [Mycena citricolor]
CQRAHQGCFTCSGCLGLGSNSLAPRPPTSPLPLPVRLRAHTLLYGVSHHPSLSPVSFMSRAFRASISTWHLILFQRLRQELGWRVCRSDKGWLTAYATPRQNIGRMPEGLELTVSQIDDDRPPNIVSGCLIE